MTWWSGVLAFRKVWPRSRKPVPTGSETTLPGIAPDNLGDAHQREDRAANRPIKVSDHESDAEGEVEALEDPHGAHAHHRNPDEAADNPHHNIE